VKGEKMRRWPRIETYMPTNIYIVEDHPVMQQTLSAHLQRFSDFAICGIAANAQDALAALSDTDVNVDLAIIDVSLPDVSGIELVNQLYTINPSLPCLMLSGHQDSTYVKRALAAGACGYVEKGNASELTSAIEQVLAGEIFLSETIRRKLDDSEEK